MKQPNARDRDIRLAEELLAKGNYRDAMAGALTPREASRYLGISDSALRLWRSKGVGPRHFAAGAKLIRYRRADLDAWVEARLCEPAAAEPEVAR